MADINRELEELAQLTQTVNDEMRKYGQVTRQTADDLKDAEMKGKYGIENFTKATEKGAEGVAALGRAGGEAAKAMFQGKKGAAAFNGSVDELTKAAQAASIALALMIPGGILFKALAAGVTAAIGALGNYTKAANEMGDKLYKGYQGLAESGAAARDGMNGLFEDAKKLGLSMDELGQYTELIAANAKDLALFSGTVFEGRQKFADTVKAMEPFKQSLMNSGLTQDQINAGAMQYLRLQTRIGASQTKTTAELGASAAKYMLEMDALTKITGVNRKEQEDIMEAARSEQRFRAKLDAMRASGDEKQIEAAGRLEKANIYLSSQSKETGQAFRDIQSGAITTEAAQKGLISSQGELMRSSEKLRNGQITELQLVNNVGKSMGAFSKSMNMSAQLGVYNDFAIDYAQTQQLAMFAQKDLTEQQRLAEEELKKQGGKGGKAADALVQQQTELRIQQQKANEVTERFVKAGIGPATDAMIVLAKATTAGTESLNKLFGINQPTKGPTEADKAAKAASEAARSAEKTAQAVVADKKTTREQKVSASQEAWKAQQAERNAAQGMPVPKAPKEKTSAPAPAAPASAAPTKAAPTKAAPTKAASTSAPSSTLSSNTRSASPVTQTPGLAAGEPDGVPPVKVPSGNGSLKLGPDADVSGVMPEMMSRLEQFAQLSGKSVNLNSAYRSDQKQAELWVRGNILNEPGIHMPAAPKDDQEITYKGKTYQVKGSGKGSLHGVGNAVDISVAGMGKSKGPMDDLLANAGLFRPFIQKDHPHVQMMAEGGIVQPTPGGTPAIIGEGGRAEAVIPLKNGSVPVSLNMAESLAGLSDNIAEQLKEIKDQSTTENDTALQQVTSEFKSAMAQMSQQLAGLAQTQNTDSMSGVVALLQDLVSATKNGVDVQQKILASNY